MVRELERPQQSDFPETAPAANPVFYRTYSRRRPDGREVWEQVCDRAIGGLKKLGKLTPDETELLYKMMRPLKSLPSGRWLWVGGTEWIEQQKNFSGAYNCTSTNVRDWRAFGLMMDLAMMGCGTGAVLEPRYIEQLPPIRNQLNVTTTGEIGSTPPDQRREETEVNIDGNTVHIQVGDSRQGWVKSYQTLLELSTDERFGSNIETRNFASVQVIVDLSDIRPAGEPLKGFGGVANPVKLAPLYQRCANLLNKTVGRQLTSVECCILIDEAAVTIVAGNIRRCLPAGALVHTEAGLVPIEKVRIGDRVLTSQGFYPVTNFFDQGVQSLCQIKTQDGVFECTPDHKVAVLTDVYGNYKMVKAKDLKEDDRLIFVPQAIRGTATELPEYKVDPQSTAKPITVPALTSEVAYFLGYLHGDGSVASDGWRVRFRITEDHTEIIDRLVKVAQDFGLETHTLRTPQQCKTKAFELQLNSAALNRYLSQFKQSFSSLSIPDCILLGTVDIRQGYLAGLADADGCHSQGVLVASVHQDFLRQVQALYASLGITTRLCASIRKRTGKWEGKLVSVGENAFDAVEALMSNYSIQFSVQKHQRPKSFKDHGFPKAMVRPLLNTYQYGWSNHQTQMIAPTLKKFIPEATDLIPVKVKSVETGVRIAQTYDIEVATVHEFVCEGILVSNSAGMRQGISTDELFAGAKENLWQQDAEGNWRIDPERDALRMANHTRVFHRKPTEQECIEATRKQYYSGEGAIQWAGEAIARANCDLLQSPEQRLDFIKAYEQGNGQAWIEEHYSDLDAEELEHRLARIGLNPCGEIIGSEFHCNLAEIHLNNIDPHNHKEQEDAFAAGAISVATLLNHEFIEPRYRYSRELDPIVGVSFTGLFDFFVNAFGVDWLRWWQEGRPDTEQGRKFKEQEAEYLTRWRDTVHRVTWEYCDKHGLKRPNRCTCVQPSGTKSLLTNASPGWHPPFGLHWIRRITFAKEDPVALACLDYGYSVVPGQSDKDENGNLLNDPFDDRVKEWLVEIPTEVPWANLPGAAEVKINDFTALAMFDFYMQVQKHWTTHNTSSTIVFTEDEIEPLGKRIYEAIRDDEGYISSALLAKFDAPFPRLPFERISKAQYEQLQAEVEKRRKSVDFAELVNYRLDASGLPETGPQDAACSGLTCEMKGNEPM